MPEEKAVFVRVEFLHDHDVPGARFYVKGERAELRDWFAEKMVREGHAQFVVIQLPGLAEGQSFEDFCDAYQKANW
jgi:hypothetical protein